MDLLNEIRAQQGDRSLRDYHSPVVLETFKQRLASDSRNDRLLQLPSFRFTRQAGEDASPRLTEHHYDVREEWLALAHRFILKHYLMASL